MKIFKGFLIVIIVIALFAASPIWAGEASKADPSLLTVDRIYKDKEFEAESFGPARWLEHKSGYTTLEDSKEKTGGKDVVRYDPRTGKRFIEVPATELIPDGNKKPLEIADYHWSKNGKYLLVFTNTKKVWRRNTRGDYWVLNLDNKQLWQLGGDVEASTLMFAKFSPDNGKVGFVIKNNLYVQILSDLPAKRKILQLTHDGSITIINGTFDWAYEEELGLQDGFRWSPDSEHIAYWQLDAEGIRDFYMINNTDTLYPEIIPVQYPKVGTINSACKVGVVHAIGGKTLWLTFPGNSRDHYIARMDWAGNSKEIVLQRLNRLQNTNKVILGDIDTGKTKTILTEKDEAWVDVDDNLKWLDNGKRFTWVSERDGWRHVYVVSRSGANVKLVTAGEFDVDKVLKIDEKRGWVYYIASPENPTRRYLFRMRLSGKGKSQRLTPHSFPGVHSYKISADFKNAIHSYSSIDTPKKIQIVSLPRHKVLRTLSANKALQSKINVLERSPVEFFRVNIGDGVLLDAWCMKPPKMDESKKYPVLFYVYGEPHGQTVKDSYSRNYLWNLMLTQQGYIVISVDNRGVASPRGRAWRKCVYRQIGILASKDQAAAVKEIIKTRPYVDAKRIGIWGWSGGGSMTLNAMFRYPDLYHTGISVAPVPDQLLYNTIYQERYMGLPNDNKEGFKNGSPIYFAHQLKGNLLLVHGTGDDNVHYQGSERLIHKLITHNKHFTMMAYPNRSHSIREGKNTTLHLYHLMTRYLNDNLKKK
jgi:dipeptidyl-peptidase 4